MGAAPQRLGPVRSGTAAGSPARCAAEPRGAGLTGERCSAPGDKWIDSVNYDSSILGRAGSVSMCPVRPAGRVAGGFVSTAQPCSVHKPRIQYALNPSSAPDSASLVPVIIVCASLCPRAGVCFAGLGVSLNALEPDVAFLVQPPLHVRGTQATSLERGVVDAHPQEPYFRSS